MEEVVGSIPTRSTKTSQQLRWHEPRGRGARRFLFHGVVLIPSIFDIPSRSQGSLAAIFQETNFGRAEFAPNTRQRKRQLEPNFEGENGAVSWSSSFRTHPPDSPGDSLR